MKIWLLILMIAVTGCSVTRSASPREEFLRSVSDRSAYRQLYEVSPESLRERERRIVEVTQALITGMRELNQRATNNDVVDQGLSRALRVAEGLFNERVQLIENLEKYYDPERDVILFFHYWPSDENQEIGYFITRRGVVKKKVLLWK